MFRVDPATAILGLELALARRDVAALPGGYAEVLDDGFVEVGQSGSVWTRDEMLMALAASPAGPSVELVGFSTEELAPTVWMARYDTMADGARVHRVSIWIRSGDRFRMRYHQGTRAIEPAG
jgi:ribonuclease HI